MDQALKVQNTYARSAKSSGQVKALQPRALPLTYCAQSRRVALAPWAGLDGLPWLPSLTYTGTLIHRGGQQEPPLARTTWSLSGAKEARIKLHGQCNVLMYVSASGAGNLDPMYSSRHCQETRARSCPSNGRGESQALVLEPSLNGTQAAPGLARLHQVATLLSQGLPWPFHLRIATPERLRRCSE